MPRYDYFCDANGEVVEVTHPMSQKLQTWGEVCANSGHALGQSNHYSCPDGEYANR
jgi:predicted nucleic acid-binding Zn ribbon protein